MAACFYFIRADSAACLCSLTLAPAASRSPVPWQLTALFLRRSDCQVRSAGLPVCAVCHNQLFLLFPGNGSAPGPCRLGLRLSLTRVWAQGPAGKCRGFLEPMSHGAPAGKSAAWSG